MYRSVPPASVRFMARFFITICFLKEFVCAELPTLESAAKGGQLVECTEVCREAQATREAQEKALAAQKAEKKEAKKKLKEGKAGAATSATGALPDAGKQGRLPGALRYF